MVRLSSDDRNREAVTLKSDVAAESLRWRKSSRSALDRDCVEVASGDSGAVYLRDSKDPDGPVMALTRGTFEQFLVAVKTGRFDRP
jgi:hypothetical protein